MKGTIRRTNKDSISWICQVELPRDPVTHKRRFKSSVASTKREAHSLVHAMLAELDSATKVDQVAATSQTVGRLIERWLEVAGPAAPSTRSVYAGYIKNQIRPHLWEIRLDRLGVADLDCWLCHVAEKRPEAGVDPQGAHDRAGGVGARGAVGMDFGQCRRDGPAAGRAEAGHRHPESGGRETSRRRRGRDRSGVRDLHSPRWSDGCSARGTLRVAVGRRRLRDG